MKKCLSIVVLAAFSALWATTAYTQNNKIKSEKMMWASYMPWMIPGKYKSYSGYDLPLNQFSSDMNEAYKQEIKIAQKYGVNGFFVCLSNVPGRKAFERLWIYKRILNASKGTNFFVNPCLDRKAKKPEGCARNIEHFINTVGNSPSLYRENGKIVFSSYILDRKNKGYWKKVKEILKNKGIEIKIIGHMTFRKSGSVYGVVNKKDILDFGGFVDGLYFFHSAFKPEENHIVLAGAAKTMGIPMWASLAPGYTGGCRSWRNDYYMPAKGFGHARDLYKAGARHSVSALHLTTWNDHDETTLMPTIFQLDSRLRIANYYKQQINSGQIIVYKTPQIFIAYKVELLMGDDLALSVQHLPVSEKHSNKLNFQVVDKQGKIITTKVIEMNNSKEELHDLCFPGKHFLKRDSVRILVDYEGKSYALPWVKINASRIDNPIVWATPLDRTAITKELKKVDFNISIKDGIASGTLKGEFTSKISRATIYRNFLPAFSLDGKNDNSRFSLVAVDDSPKSRSWDTNQIPATSHKKSISYRLECLNGKIVRVGHNLSKVRFFRNRVIYHNSKRGPALFEVNGNPEEIIFRINNNKKSSKTIKLSDIISNNGVSVALNEDTKRKILVKPFPLDPAPWSTPAVGSKSIDSSFRFTDNVPAAASNSYSARLELENGKVVWTDPIFPNKGNSRTTDNILLTGRDWDSCFGWNSGKYKYSEDLVKSLLLSPQVLRVDTYGLKKGTGTILENSTGMRNARSMHCKRVELKGKPALELDGKKSYIKLPPKSMMNGSFSFSAWIFPERTDRPMGIFSDKAGKKMSHIYLMITKDGHLFAEKSTIKNRIEESYKIPWISATHVMHKLTTKDKVKFGQWNHIILTYNLKSLKVYLNGKLSAEKKLPPIILRSNSWPTVGCRSSGDRGRHVSEMFKGEIGPFIIAGYPR